MTSCVWGLLKAFDYVAKKMKFRYQMSYFTVFFFINVFLGGKNTGLAPCNTLRGLNVGTAPCI